MIPLHREPGDGAEEVGLGAEALEMLDRLADEQIGLLAGPVGAEQRDERLLAAAAILTDALAGLRLFALSVKQVVGDLEGEADVARLAA